MSKFISFSGIKLDEIFTSGVNFGRICSTICVISLFLLASIDTLTSMLYGTGEYNVFLDVVLLSATN